MANKDKITQKELKNLLGKELELYAKAHGMQAPVAARRCWTLEYADGAQFHLDALPAIPDGDTQRRKLEASMLDAHWAQSAIAITDVDHPHFLARSPAWPHSNPVGYTEWFRSRMRVTFTARRQAMALQEKAGVEDIPSYRVKTPLQQAIQILKRHRDILFADDWENKPISVIITTLAAQSYGNESTVAQALAAILEKMDAHIVERNGVRWIENPTDPTENFADRWRTHPHRYECFKQWLAKARKDFLTLIRQTDRQMLIDAATPFAGRRLAEKAGAQAPAMRFQSSLFAKIAPLFSAAHRQAAPWPVVTQGQAAIKKAMFRRNGFRSTPFSSDGSPLPKNASLTFHAKTDVPMPYSVYWQVVNSGPEAMQANGLRGGFDAGSVDKGGIVRHESTSYSGSHSIECFIVKNGYLVARSGRFIVNIG